MPRKHPLEEPPQNPLPKVPSPDWPRISRTRLNDPRPVRLAVSWSLHAPKPTNPDLPTRLPARPRNRRHQQQQRTCLFLLMSLEIGTIKEGVRWYRGSSCCTCPNGKCLPPPWCLLRRPRQCPIPPRRPCLIIVILRSLIRHLIRHESLHSAAGSSPPSPRIIPDRLFPTC